MHNRYRLSGVNTLRLSCQAIKGFLAKIIEISAHVWPLVTVTRLTWGIMGALWFVWNAVIVLTNLSLPWMQALCSPR